MEEMFRIGVITSTHGVHGEVKVFPTTEDVRRFDRLKKVILKPAEGRRQMAEIELTVAGVKYFKQFAIVRFQEIDDINAVEQYKGMEMYVRREDAIPLEEGEYYIADLIGLTVTAEQDGYPVLGILKDVLQTGANDVYVVEAVESLDKREILIPAIKQCIEEVDLDKRIMKVHLLKGLV